MKYRYFLLIIWIIWIGVAIYFSSMLQPLSEPEVYLPKDHPIEQFKTDLATYFGGDIYVLEIHMYWGVKNIDKSETSMWDGADIGKVIFDDEFTLTTIEA